MHLNVQTLTTICMLHSALTTAHFVLHSPESLGFESEEQTLGPCGGPSFSTSTTSDFHVGGDAIAYQLLHTQANLIYRGTLDQDLESTANWSVLWPTYTQFGLGSFCQPAVPAPDSWAGQTGTIQVIEDAEDGTVYQCAVVNFISGTVETLPESCRNASGVSASFSSDSALSDSPPGSENSDTTASTESAGARTALKDFGFGANSAFWLMIVLLSLAA